MSDVEILMVTCCLEPTRANVLSQVIHNLNQQAPELSASLTVFDNASTEEGVIDQLKSHFNNVYRCDRNVGYWSAIDWWLDKLQVDPPKYTYIIESDMMHYNLKALGSCVKFLNDYPELGSMRLHEYSVKNRRLYDKSVPVIGSRKNIWQSHINYVTGEQIVHQVIKEPFWATNFLTHLPALNRYSAMNSSFNFLRKQTSFAETDFQRQYHSIHPKISLIDGGIFTVDLNPCDKDKMITSSYTSPEELKRLGYQTTRYASITPRDQYIVQRV